MKINKRKEKYEDLVMSFSSLNLRVNRTERKREKSDEKEEKAFKIVSQSFVDHIIVTIKFHCIERARRRRRKEKSSYTIDD